MDNQKSIEIPVMDGLMTVSADEISSYHPFGLEDVRIVLKGHAGEKREVIATCSYSEFNKRITDMQG